MKPNTHNRVLRLRPINAIVMYGLALMAAPAVQAASTISQLDPSGTYFAGDGLAITPDGNTVAGRVQTGSLDGGMRWTASGGVQALGSHNGWTTWMRGISHDGTTLVGFSQDGAQTNQKALRWTQATGYQDLGSLGGTRSIAQAISGDGTTIVGHSTDAGGIQRAFRWTAAGGMVALPALGSGNGAGAAKAVSADGSVIVGYANNGSGTQKSFRWTAAGGMQELASPTGAGEVLAQAASSDANTIAGRAQVSATSHQQAFLWTSTGGAEWLGYLPGGSYSNAMGLSMNGKVAVGEAYNSNGTLKAVVWIRGKSIQTVEEWLAADGVVVSPSLSTNAAYAANQDGTVIVGRLTNGHGFIARGSVGLIDTQDFNSSLYSVAHQQSRALNEADLVMNGLHSRPTAFTLKTGQGTMWVGGDLGRAERVPGKGTVGNGELGVAYGLTDTLMLRAAVGRTGSDIDSDGGSNVETSGTFVLPELVAQLGDSPFLLSASAYYNSGKARIRRGYLNAGTPEHADGTPDVSSKALRLRLDWLDAYKSERLSLTPYASMSWYRSHVDSYTEKGGNFPVSWEAQQERQSILRLGTDLRYALSDDVTLTGLLELAHRSRQNGEGAQGRIIGLSSFKLEGMAYPRSWVRLGVGLDAKVGPGVLGIMLNANSRNSGNRWWLNASYRIPF
ncbi:autotransporter domain-containing protein [Leeia sp.]|uniref:autotransporter domain-containing protein n=1 Tax=Leeia sp. TaxID=2884678 RepID=UPI0035B1295D